MLPPELGRGDETARVHHASWWRGGSVAACRARAHAKLFRIGFFPLGSPANQYDQSLVDSFRRGLRRIGLVENRDIALEITWISGGNPIGMGLVRNLPNPGFNVTGFSDGLGEISGKLIDVSAELRKPGVPA